MSYGYNKSNMNTNVTNSNKQTQQNISSGNGKCSNNHNLEIREDRTTYQCNSCSKVWLPKSFTCLKCNFDLCEKCGLKNISNNSNSNNVTQSNTSNNQNTQNNNQNLNANQFDNSYKTKSDLVGGIESSQSTQVY